MKKIRLLFCILMTLCFAHGVQAKLGATFNSVDVLYGKSNDVNASFHYFFSLLSPTGGVYYGEYTHPNKVAKVGDVLVNVSWTGPGPAPSMKVKSAKNADKSLCPGLPGGWSCASLVYSITVESDGLGCPWMASVYSVVTSQTDGSYRAPAANSTECPTVPVASYDISWSEHSVQHNRLLNLKSTGGVIEQTLSTYLMEGGKLCDKNAMDERGGYCRFVANLIAFTAEGCDDSNVTVTATQHVLTDKPLHDMLVHVDTTSRQPIDSTCRFQYILNEL